MVERLPRRPVAGGLVEPETVSGQWRQQAFEAKHELAEAKRRIAELESEAAQVEDRRRNVEVDILKGMTTNMQGIVAAEVAAEVARVMAHQPAPSWTLNVNTPPPFQPVPLAAPILPPATAHQPALPGLPAMVGGPVAPGLPPMRQQAPSSVSDQDIADAAANAKAERRLRMVGILAIPVGTLAVAAVGAVASYASATHAPVYSTQPVYVQSGQPPALPTMAHPPAPLPH